MDKSLFLKGLIDGKRLSDFLKLISVEILLFGVERKVFRVNLRKWC